MNRILIKRTLAALPLTVLLLAKPQAQPTPPPYKNAKRPTAVRVADLLKRMTLEGKVVQLYCHWEASAKRKIFTKRAVDEAKLALVAPTAWGR